MNQGGDLSPFPPSHLSQPSQPLIDYPPVAGDITIDPRYLEYVPSTVGFPIALRNSITPPEVHDHQSYGNGDPIQEPIPGHIPAAVTASPGMAVYSPPFNQTLGIYTVSGPPFLSSLVNRGIVHPSCISYQTERSGQSTSRQLDQTYQDSPTPSTSTGQIGGVGVDQHPHRHQCSLCDADYAGVSGLNRHHTEKHLPWMACNFCGFQYPLGRSYLLTKHLKRYHPNA